MILQKLSSPFREFGGLGGVLYLIDRFFVRVSSGLRLYHYELMVQPIPAKPLFPARMNKLLECRELRKGDPELDSMPLRPGILEARLAQGAICLGAFQKGELIGYIWFCFGSYEEDEVRCTYELTPKQESVFDFDLYLYPPYRMGFGFVGIWEGANQFLRQRGVRFTFSRLTRSNLDSRRAHAHLGWKRVGQAVFLQAWLLELMVATIFPYVHISLLKSRRVRLQLSSKILVQQQVTPIPHI